MLVKSSISTKMFALLAFAGVLTLSACSESSDAEKKASAPSSQGMTNTMDVKQPEPKAIERESLAEMPAPAAVEAPAVVEAPKEAAKVDAPAVVEAPKETAKVEAPAAPVAVAQVSGEKVYATCIGCHGAQGEGGVGPKLAGQVVADVVDKLKRYKAGEQVGPMTGMMAPMATGLSEADMQAVAEYVTKL